MFDKVFNYKPAEQDYRVWLVMNPAKVLLPILVTVLVTALVVHVSVFEIVKPWTVG